MPKVKTSWKKGQSGNPRGAPKKEWTWKAGYTEALEEMAKDGKPIKYHLIRSSVKKALEGDMVAIKEIANRMDGDIPRWTDITSNGKDINSPFILVGKGVVSGKDESKC